MIIVQFINPWMMSEPMIQSLLSDFQLGQAFDMSLSLSFLSLSLLFLRCFLFILEHFIFFFYLISMVIFEPMQVT